MKLLKFITDTEKTKEDNSSNLLKNALARKNSVIIVARQEDKKTCILLTNKYILLYRSNTQIDTTFHSFQSKKDKNIFMCDHWGNRPTSDAYQSTEWMQRSQCGLKGPKNHPNQIRTDDFSRPEDIIIREGVVQYNVDCNSIWGQSWTILLQ